MDIPVKQHGFFCRVKATKTRFSRRASEQARGESLQSLSAMKPSGSFPLQGVKVIELGTLIAGPFCARMLAEFGAEVIKVESPKGGDPLRKWRKLYEGTSLWWYAQARNKKSVTLDLKHPEAQQIVRQLAKEHRISSGGNERAEVRRRTPRPCRFKSEQGRFLIIGEEWRGHGSRFALEQFRQPGEKAIPMAKNGAFGQISSRRDIGD